MQKYGWGCGTVCIAVAPLIPKDATSTPAIGDVYKHLFIYLGTVKKKGKRRRKRPGMAHFVRLGKSDLFSINGSGEKIISNTYE